MKKIIPIILLVLISLTIAACGKTGVIEKKTITVGAPSAPPTLPILRMIETKALGEDVEIKIDIWNEAESLIAMVQDGKHDIFAFPLTVVAKLYRKGLDVRLMNVSTWGVTYFMTSDPSFKEWADLKGKTVYIPLQSSPPDALTQYFIATSGLKAGHDVNLVYASNAEVAALLASGKAVYGTLFEPQATKAMLENKNLHVGLSFEKEWQRVNNTATKIPNAGMGTTQRFINKNPELASKFQKAYAEALNWAIQNPVEMGKLAEKHLGLKASLVVSSLPHMGLEFKTAVDSQTELSMFYRLLFNFNPTMIGGKVPDAALYYERKP